MDKNPEYLNVANLNVANRAAWKIEDITDFIDDKIAVTCIGLEIYAAREIELPITEYEILDENCQEYYGTHQDPDEYARAVRRVTELFFTVMLLKIDELIGDKPDVIDEFYDLIIYAFEQHSHNRWFSLANSSYWLELVDTHIIKPMIEAARDYDSVFNRLIERAASECPGLVETSFGVFINGSILESDY